MSLHKEKGNFDLHTTLRIKIQIMTEKTSQWNTVCVCVTEREREREIIECFNLICDTDTRRCRLP